MSAIGVIATLTITSGKEADFEAAMATLMAATRSNEPGNIFYACFRSRDDATVYKVLEQYADQAALDAHGASAHFKAAGPALGACLSAAPHVEYMDGF